MILRKFPKIKNLGDRILRDLFDGDIEITEKIDGSQFRIYLNTEGTFEVGSKNQIGLELFKSRIEMTKSRNKHDMFDLAVEQAEILKAILKDILFDRGWKEIALYTEYLRTIKHNALKYDRVPKNHLYLFGGSFIAADYGDNEIQNLLPPELITIANLLDIEHLNTLYIGKVRNQEDLKRLLETESVLGGTKIEGIVIKNYSKTYPGDLLSTEAYVGFPLAGKLVRDEYREVQRGEWGRQKKKGSIEEIVETYLTTTRFMKSIQHLRDEDKLTFEKKDLAVLIPEFLSDLKSEEEENINHIILSKFWENLRRRISHYVVEQYNEYLLSQQFRDT